MKNFFSLGAALIFVYMVFALSSCAMQEEMAAKPAAPAAAAKAEKAAPAKVAEEKAPAKAKAEKVKGDVGLLDLEKNYMILVTKEGKLITVDFDPKVKATEVTPTPAKVSDIGLGSSAVVEYTKSADKNVATKLEFRPAKGGD